jgi:hypothetical protein
VASDGLTARKLQLEGGKGGASKRRVKVENTGEDQLKVKWREEEHKSDDDMDCQQVGHPTLPCHPNLFHGQG